MWVTITMRSDMQSRSFFMRCVRTLISVLMLDISDEQRFFTASLSQHK